MKRVVLFLVLLALGIVALRLAIGDEAVVTASGPVTDPQEDKPQDNGAGGIPIARGQTNAKLQTRGAIHYPKVHAIPMPDGSERNETVFVLDAKDSQPVRDGLQQLDDVTVTFFDRNQEAGILKSRQAFVELGRDLSNQVSLREDKEIDLREAVFDALPSSRLAGLHLELGNAKVLVRDDYVQLRTSAETDPVLLVLDGKSKATLHGNGLQARLPRDRRGALQRTDIDVLHDPVVESGGLVARAVGRLHYTEDLAEGSAQITLEHEVVAEFASSGSLDLRGEGVIRQRGKAVAHGDQLNGWLQRGKRIDETGTQREDLAWQLVQLRGAPATIDAPGGRLSTPKVTLVPGMSGEPFVVTASDGISRLEEILDPEQRARGLVPTVGESPRRIHLLRPGEQTSSIHRAYGFPLWTLNQLKEQQTVAFEGSSQLTGTSREKSPQHHAQLLRASRGFHAFRPSTAGKAALLEGFGDVHIEQHAARPGEQDLIATGNDGFRLLATPSGDTIDLGPAQPAKLDVEGDAWHLHHYELSHGKAHVSGVGSCRVDRDAARTVLTLRAPGSEIRGNLGGEAGELSAVRSLRAELVGNEVTDLFATGLPAMATIDHDGDHLLAKAPVVRQLDRASVSLLPPQAGADPSLWHGLAMQAAMPRLQHHTAARPGREAYDLDAAAPRIDLHYLGREDVIADVIGNDAEPVHATGSIQRTAKAAPTAFSLDAHRLRLFPYLLPPLVQLAHNGGARGLAAELPAFVLGRAWLLGDDVSRLVIDDPEQGHIEGAGHLLLLSQGAQAGMFVGDPDSMTQTVVTQTTDGRSVTASGACVRVFRETAIRLQALRTYPGRPLFVLPTVVLHHPDSNNPLAHMTASCRGDIDVLPEAVVFQGPVVANSLLADGSPDPKGMHIEAEQLNLVRHPKTGTIDKVLGRHVNMDWEDMNAQSASVELDMTKTSTRLLAVDPQGAKVTRADGSYWVAERIEVQYGTRAVDWYHGRFYKVRKTEGVDR